MAKCTKLYLRFDLRPNNSNANGKAIFGGFRPSLPRKSHNRWFNNRMYLGWSTFDRGESANSPRCWFQASAINGLFQEDSICLRTWEYSWICKWIQIQRSTCSNTAHFIASTISITWKGTKRTIDCTFEPTEELMTDHFDLKYSTISIFNSPTLLILYPHLYCFIIFTSFQIVTPLLQIQNARILTDWLF